MRGESDGKATRAAKICAAKRDDFVGVFLILFACLIFGVIGEAAQSVSEALQGIPQWVFVMIAIVLVLAFAGVVALFFWLRLRRRQIWLAHVHTLGDLLALTPTQFELAVGELLTRWGYRDVRHTGGGGDLAADLTCRTADGRLLVVQCKRYAPGNSVGSPEVQTFIGMLNVHHGTRLGIFVTTSSFTQPALALARQHNLRTIDGNELTQYIQQMQAQVQA